MMTDRKKTPWKKAALIGGGRMGCAHAQALRELGVSLSAICDINKDSCDAAGEAFGVPESGRFLDAAALFDVMDPFDVVVVATTSDMHKELTCMAAQAGARNILCEKPMAVSVRDCDLMIEACAAAGAGLAINHQMRFMEQYRLVKKVLAQGRLGRLSSMTVVAGCFGLAMNASHYFEAFRYLTDCAPVSAWGWFSGEPIPSPRGPLFFDQAGDFRIENDPGQRLYLSIGADQGHGMTVTYAGAHGHIFVDELQGEAIITERRPKFREMPMTRYGMPWTRETRLFSQADNVGPTKAVLAALAAGENYPSGEDGRQVVASLAACYSSAENGHGSVRLDALGDARDRIFPWA